MRSNDEQTMNDLLMEHQSEDQAETNVEKPQEEIVFDDSYNKKLKEYNKNIKKLDKEFAKLRPRLKVLVRCYMKELKEDENGVLQVNTSLVTAKTKSGIGVVGSMTNPYPYSRNAVIVAVPDHYKDIPGLKDLKPKQEVVLANNPVTAVAVGYGHDAQINIPSSFIHPDHDEMSVPQDPQNQNFGYLLVDSSKIEFLR